MNIREIIRNPTTLVIDCKTTENAEIIIQKIRTFGHYTDSINIHFNCRIDDRFIVLFHEKNSHKWIRTGMKSFEKTFDISWYIMKVVGAKEIELYRNNAKMYDGINLVEIDIDELYIPDVNKENKEFAFWAFISILFILFVIFMVKRFTT